MWTSLVGHSTYSWILCWSWVPVAQLIPIGLLCKALFLTVFRFYNYVLWLVSQFGWFSASLWCRCPWILLRLILLRLRGRITGCSLWWCLLCCMQGLHSSYVQSELFTPISKQLLKLLLAPSSSGQNLSICVWLLNWLSFSGKTFWLANQSLTLGLMKFRWWLPLSPSSTFSHFQEWGFSPVVFCGVFVHQYLAYKVPDMDCVAFDQHHNLPGYACTSSFQYCLFQQFLCNSHQYRLLYLQYSLVKFKVMNTVI